MGAGLGFSTTLSTLYIMEVATPQMRSGLAVVPAVAGTLGVLYCQLLGALLEWQSLSLVLAGHNAPFFIMLLFIPETPVYLLGKEQVGFSLRYQCHCYPIPKYTSMSISVQRISARSVAMFCYRFFLKFQGSALGSS